jgi:hypothetical protein
MTQKRNGQPCGVSVVPFERVALKCRLGEVSALVDGHFDQRCDFMSIAGQNVQGPKPRARTRVT